MRGENDNLGMQTHALNSPSSGGSVPTPEVREKARRRKFSASFKSRILKEADACSSSGDVGALLRREGLYSSHLTLWRKQRREGTLQALGNKRGRKGKSAAEIDAARLRRENAKLRRRLERAEFLIEIQKKASAILGIDLPPIPPEEDDEEGNG